MPTIKVVATQADRQRLRMLKLMRATRNFGLAARTLGMTMSDAVIAFDRLGEILTRIGPLPLHILPPWKRWWLRVWYGIK